jgi:hypothetical protein
MNRSLQITITAAVLVFGHVLAAPLQVSAQMFGNMGQQIRDAQERQNQSIQRLRNFNRPRMTTPGVSVTTRPQITTPGVVVRPRRQADDFYVEPDPIPDGQGGAGGQNDPGLEADGQGGRGQGNDDRERNNSNNSNNWDFGFRVVPTYDVPQGVLVSPSTSCITSATPQENILPTLGVIVPDVVLLNPTRNGGSVNYTLNDVRCTMAAGFQQKLPGERAWIIEFDRGGSFGTARYSLTPGKYAFAVTERGWDVFRRTPVVAAEATVPAPAVPEVAQVSP